MKGLWPYRSIRGGRPFGKRIERIANQVREVRDREVEVAIVVGAGNIYRGMAAAAEGMDRATADYMGMLATVLNALTLQDALEQQGSPLAQPKTWRLPSVPARSSC